MTRTNNNKILYVLRKKKSQLYIKLQKHVWQLKNSIFLLYQRLESFSKWDACNYSCRIAFHIHKLGVATIFPGGICCINTLNIVFVSYSCLVWQAARIVVLSLWKLGISHCLWLLRFFEAGHTISDKLCPSITRASWIWSLPHKYLIFQSSVTTFNYLALVGTQRSVLTFQKLLKQTCYCLLHILGFKTLELTTLASVLLEHHSIMESVLTQTHKKPAKQFKRKMLSYKETEWLVSFSSVVSFPPLTPMSKART